NVFDAEAALDLVDNDEFLAEVPKSAELDATLAMHGVDRFAARTKLVERMAAAGRLAKIEPSAHTVPHGDRSGAVIEPYLTDQWYVDAETLAAGPIAPKPGGKTCFDWRENIQPWCVSRQLWWGHKMPAWYGPDGKVFVAESEDEALADALAYDTVNGAITEAEADAIARDPARRSQYLTPDEHL